MGFRHGDFLQGVGNLDTAGLKLFDHVWAMQQFKGCRPPSLQPLFEKAANPLTKRVVELERDKRRLERRLKQAELLLEIQKKASQLLEIPLGSRDDEDGSA